MSRVRSHPARLDSMGDESPGGGAEGAGGEHGWQLLPVFVPCVASLLRSATFDADCCVVHDVMRPKGGTLLRAGERVVALNGARLVSAAADSAGGGATGSWAGLVESRLKVLLQSLPKPSLKRPQSPPDGSAAHQSAGGAIAGSIAATLLVQRALGASDEPVKQGGVYKIRRYLDTSRSSLVGQEAAIRSAKQLADDLQNMHLKSDLKSARLNSPRE